MDKKKWMADAIEMLPALIKNEELVTGEDFRFALAESGFPEPNHPNTWGALVGSMKKLDMLVETGEHRPMTGAKSNGRKTPIYFFVHQG